MLYQRLARHHTSESAGPLRYSPDRLVNDYAATSPINLPHLQHWAEPTWDFSRVGELGTSVPRTAGAFGTTSAGHTYSANIASQSPGQSSCDLPEPGAAGTPVVQQRKSSKAMSRKPVNPSQGQQSSSTDSTSAITSHSSSSAAHSCAIGSRILKESRPKLVRQRPLQSDCLLPQDRQGLHERREDRRKERRLASPQENCTGSRDAKRARNPQKAPAYDHNCLTESELISHQTTTTADTSNDSVRSINTLTCISCTLDLPAKDFSNIPLTQSCDHVNSACKDCVKQWVETRLGDGSWNEIKCLECNEVMQYLDVQRHANPEVFRRYDTMAARSWLNSEDNFVWCRNQGCGSGQVHEGGKNLPLFQCVACRSRYCVVHEEPWHEGETCAAFDRRMNGEDPIEEGESSDHAAAQPFVTERQRRVMTFAEANDIQDRRLYDQARRRRTRTEDAQLARDFDAALALQYADDDTSHYESTGSKYRPPQSPAERFYFGPRSMQAPTSRRHIVEKFFEHRTREENYLNEDPSPYIRSSAIRLTQDEEPASTLQEQPARDASYARSLQEEYEQYEKDRRAAAGRKARRQRAAWQCADDASYARNLQKQFEQEDRNRSVSVEQEVKRQGSIREADDRAARRQSTSDAKAARALHDQFEWEGRDRVERRQREDRAQQEREAYQRRKAEEREGEQTVKSNAKQCPSCRWYIQKNDGCDHMTCWKCHYEFCWVCLVDYQSIRNNGNSAHKVSCRDYRR